MADLKVAQERGLETFTDPEGREWAIGDIFRLFDASQKMLSPRQAQAIKWFLAEQMFEADVAERMGLSRTNPIGMYATAGIERLMELVDFGAIKGFGWGG